MPLYQEPSLWAKCLSYLYIIHLFADFSVTELQKSACTEGIFSDFPASAAKIFRFSCRADYAILGSKERV